METGITKEHLQQRRKTLWKKWLWGAGLDLELYPWWSEEDRVLEIEVWEKADKDYEAMKLKYRDLL